MASVYLLMLSKMLSGLVYDATNACSGHHCAKLAFALLPQFVHLTLNGHMDISSNVKRVHVI